jgi:hypothetical protein
VPAPDAHDVGMGDAASQGPAATGEPMIVDEILPPEIPEGAAPGKELAPAARRALAEAAERRRAIDAKAAGQAKEHQGRGGLDPVRYDDWEVKGLAADF